MVQEGTGFRCLQPLTPDHVKHINSVLKMNRLEIQTRAKEVESGADGGQRGVVYNESLNTRIACRVNPEDLKKTPSKKTPSKKTPSKKTPSKKAPSKKLHQRRLNTPQQRQLQKNRL
jgi:hypothetical protein